MSPDERIIRKYMDDVLEGRIVAGLFERLAVERQVNDLKTGSERGLFFDTNAAQHRLDFYPFCRFTKGRWKGRTFQPSPEQMFIKWCTYGWYRDTGKRRFRESYLSMARKQGKTEEAATDALYLLGFDGENSAEIYSAATKKSQALIVLEAAAEMIHLSKPLRAKLQVGGTRKNPTSIYSPDTNSKFTALAKSPKTEDGKGPSGVIVDEYHAHPDSKLKDVLESGMFGRDNPMLSTITTRGTSIDSPCYEFEEMVMAILKGDIENDGIFGMIFSLDKDDKGNYEDWEDWTLWRKANPNLGVSVDLEDLKQKLLKAKEISSNEIEFRTKNLNMWTESKQLWLSTKMWARGGGELREEDYYGRPAFGGLDLSSTMDFSAWNVSVQKDDHIANFTRYFVPEGQVRKIEDLCKINLRDWVKRGIVQATPGDVVDYSFIYEQIMADRKRFKLQELGYDPWNATQLATQLTDQGLTPIEYRQGYGTMSPVCKAFEIDLGKGYIKHGDNLCTSWMARCAEAVYDNNDNLRLSKPKRDACGKRIDGIVAMLLGHARAKAGKPPPVLGFDFI